MSSALVPASNAALFPQITPRWTQLRPHRNGEAYSLSLHKYNVVPAGRRSGKTERAKRKIVMRALTATTPWNPRFFAGAPTRDQAKQIFWDDIKALIPAWALDPRKSVSEQHLTVYCRNGAQIVVVGMDKPQRIEGQPWDGGVLDEVANMKPEAWPANVQPALADRDGWCDLIGVPEGRNHYYKLYTKAQALMGAYGAASEWGAFTWFSSEVLPEPKIESAKRDLDELTFQQEYEASFLNFEGRAYYPFTRESHTAALTYNPKATLILCFDFNVDPGICAILQEQLLPKQYEHDGNGRLLLDRPITGTGVIGEVWIPRNSNTPAVCKKVIADWADKHVGRVECYGDATGGSRGTAKVQGSDWQLIEQYLRPVFRERLSFHVDQSNPPERTRVNAMNSRLKSATGDIRLLVDPYRAEHVMMDFEGVTLLKGGSGEIDKSANRELTHLTDAIGYYVQKRFPVQGAGMTNVRLLGF